MAELSNEFAFSWSRQKIFYDCPRKLYWQYYGSWGGWEDEASRDARLAYRLKNLKTLSMLIGETFHEELAEILQRRPSRPAGIPVKQLKDDMERRLLKRLRESRNADWERFGNPKQYTILFEDYYKVGIDERMEAEARATLHSCVDGLAASGFGRRAFAAPKEHLIFIDPRDMAEKRVTVDGLILYASPDLVVKGKSGGLHIIDWKTGKPYKANVAQLAVYGIFVQEKFEMPLERLTAHLIYVNARENHEQSVVEGVEEARRVIATYVEDVKGRLTDPVANVAGDIEGFPMTKNTVLCRSCNFRELCGRLEDAPQLPQADD